MPDETSSLFANKYTFRKITFPFYAIFSFETIGDPKLPTEKVGIELMEDSNWLIQIDIDH